MPLDPQVIAEINTASATLGKVLMDVQGAVPPGSAAGIALSSASILLPTVISLILNAIEAVQAHQTTPPAAAPAR